VRERDTHTHREKERDTHTHTERDTHTRLTDLMREAIIPSNLLTCSFSESRTAEWRDQAREGQEREQMVQLEEELSEGRR